MDRGSGWCPRVPWSCLAPCPVSGAIRRFHLCSSTRPAVSLSVPHFPVTAADHRPVPQCRAHEPFRFQRGWGPFRSPFPPCPAGHRWQSGRACPTDLCRSRAARGVVSQALTAQSSRGSSPADPRHPPPWMTCTHSPPRLGDASLWRQAHRRRSTSAYVARGGLVSIHPIAWMATSNLA